MLGMDSSDFVHKRKSKYTILTCRGRSAKTGERQKVWLWATAITCRVYIVDRPGWTKVHPMCNQREFTSQSEDAHEDRSGQINQRLVWREGELLPGLVFTWTLASAISVNINLAGK